MRDFYATSAHAPLFGQAEGRAPHRAVGRTLNPAEGGALERAEGRAFDQAEGRALDQAEGRALDQAEGLRQLFAGQPGSRRRVLALAANPYVSASAIVLDRLSATISALGRQVLVVDAAASAPAPHELARLDLVAGMELTMPGVAYLPARGLPLQFVDTRGSAARFIEALFDKVPSVDVLLLHAEAGELARLLTRHPTRPLLLAADHPESLKHAYASCKLLRRRTGIGTFDALLAASAFSPRAAGIAASLRTTADHFLGALIHAWALVDPASADDPAATEAPAWPHAERLDALLAAHLVFDEELGRAAEPAQPGLAAAPAALERFSRLPTE